MRRIVNLCILAVFACVIASAQSVRASGGTAAALPASADGVYHVCAGCTFTQLSAAIAAAEANDGAGTVVLDPGYRDVITSTLQVGSAGGTSAGTGSVKVIMMPGSVIQEDVSDGSPGIEIGDGSSLECLGATPSGNVNGSSQSNCEVVAENGADMSSMVTSSIFESALSNHLQGNFGLQGITFIPYGATISDAVLDAFGIDTPSLVANNTFLGGPNVAHVLHIGYGTGGGKIFVNNEIRNAYYIQGSEVLITGAENNWNWDGQSDLNVTSPEIDGGEISCRNGAYPAVQIDGDPAGVGDLGVMHVTFDNVWSQDCGSGPFTAPYIAINNADDVVFKNMEFAPDSPVAALITDDDPAGYPTNFISFRDVTVACREVNCAGQTWIVDKTSQGYTHPFPSETYNLPHAGYFVYIPFDKAGGWPSSSMTESEPPTNNSDSTVGTQSYADAGAGSALNVGNGNAIDLSFGGNGYTNAWIESYQHGTATGKALFINKEYNGGVDIGGDTDSTGGFSVGGIRVTPIPYVGLQGVGPRLQASAGFTPVAGAPICDDATGNTTIYNCGVVNSALQYCGVSTFRSSTIGSVVTCGFTPGHCLVSWTGTPPSATVAEGTLSGQHVTPAASSRTWGTASVYCSAD